MTRVAGIDCGTNSIRLLIADIDDTGVTDVERTMQIVRLGEGVDATGRLSDAALERTLAACEVYAALIHQHGAERVRFVATSATRDASNRAVFVDGVRARLGVDPEVISGTEEAALSFAGATLDAADPGPYLVVDIGGGSTEFVYGQSSPQRSTSVDIGCVRMTERHLHDDPPSAGQVEAAIADIDAAIARAADVTSAAKGATLLGLAGSVTTVAGIALDLPTYDPVVLHRSRISAAAVSEVSARLLRQSRVERAAIPVMHPGRVDVIAAGALILARIVLATGAGQVVVSERDILDGIALSLAD